MALSWRRGAGKSGRDNDHGPIPDILLTVIPRFEGPNLFGRQFRQNQMGKVHLRGKSQRFVNHIPDCSFREPAAGLKKKLADQQFPQVNEACLDVINSPLL